MAHRVIIIDDDSFFRSLAKDILEHNGFEVMLSANVESFLQGFNMLETPPDLILFDVNLGPSITGDQLLELFKEMLAQKGVETHTRLVIMSSLSDAELQELSLKCGADGYIKKSSLNIDYGGYIFSNKVKAFLENRDEGQ